MSDILQFTAENRYLSNFYRSEVELDGIMYPSVENAYQASKTFDQQVRECMSTCKPSESKRLGNAVKLRSDWESVKISIMESLVRQKFTRHLHLRQLLLATDGLLVEGNWWNDTFWGVCKGVGENNLGKILMKVREELRTQGD